MSKKKNAEEVNQEKTETLTQDPEQEKDTPEAPSFEVLRNFRDKDTLKVFKAGDSYEGNVKRIKELQIKGFLGDEDESSKAK